MILEWVCTVNNRLGASEMSCRGTVLLWVATGNVLPYYLLTTSNGNVAQLWALHMYLVQYLFLIDLDIWKSQNPSQWLYSPILSLQYLFRRSTNGVKVLESLTYYHISSYLRLTGANVTLRAFGTTSFVISSPSLTHHQTPGTPMFPRISPSF